MTTRKQLNPASMREDLLLIISRREQKRPPVRPIYDRRHLEGAVWAAMQEVFEGASWEAAIAVGVQYLRGTLPERAAKHREDNLLVLEANAYLSAEQVRLGSVPLVIPLPEQCA